jgi:hypothetical protein
MRPPPLGDRRSRADTLTEHLRPAQRRQVFPAQRLAMAPFVRAVLMVVGIGVLLVVLTWPLFTVGSRLLGDAPTDAWFIAHQADSLGQGYLPSLFLHFDSGIFYPVFAFYGGTMFAFAGAISLLVGPPMAAQAIVYVLALGAAYGGWFWLARMAGVRFWLAHAPALLYVTAPYVMTNVNVRQDLAESVATSAIPLLLASALNILRADRLRPGPFAALAMSTILVGGSHNLTLLWATTILGLSALAIAAGVPQTRRMVTRRGLLRVLAVMVPAMAVNAWYLLPDLAYHADTVIAQRIDEWQAMVKTPGPEINAQHLFALGRTGPFPGSAFTVALPVFAIAWVLAAAIAIRKQWRSTWARTLMVLSVLSIAVTIVMTHPRLLTVLPDPWLMIQFSYRLESFVLYGICGATIAALVLLDHSPHRWVAALLIPILAFSVIGAISQVRDVPRRADDVPLSIDTLKSFSTGDFADASLRPRPQTDPAPIMVYTRVDVERDRFETTIPARPHEIVYLDVMSLSRMVDVQGARVVGRWAVLFRQNWQPRWYLALRIDDDATPGKAHIVIREAQTLPIVGGRIISLLGLLGLAANAAMIVRGRLRRRAS